MTNRWGNDGNGTDYFLRLQITADGDCSHEIERRLIAEGNGNPLQYSCLENSMDRGAWWTAVHGVT